MLNEEVRKMQNDDIIQAIRSKKINARELQTIITSIADLVDMKRKEANTESATSGQNIQKQEDKNEKKMSVLSKLQERKAVKKRAGQIPVKCRERQ